MKNKAFGVKNLVLGAMFLALALLLPLLTGQIPQFGQALCPMHFPVILAGFICGGPVGAVVGFAAPLLRGVIFGMPPVYPTGLAMAFELMSYGLLSGLLYKLFGKVFKNDKSGLAAVFSALILAMLAGRVVWGIVRLLMTVMTPGADPFTFTVFIGGAILGSIPGIIAQIILIPAILFALKRTKLIPAAVLG